MNISKDGPRGSSQPERLIQHVVQVVTVAAIVGGTTLMFNVSRSVAVIETQLVSMQKRLDDLRLLMNDRYTGAQAARDFGVIENQLSDHEDRIRDLEKSER